MYDPKKVINYRKVVGIWLWVVSCLLTVAHRNFILCVPIFNHELKTNLLSSKMSWFTYMARSFLLDYQWCSSMLKCLEKDTVHQSILYASKCERESTSLKQHVKEFPQSCGCCINTHFRSLKYKSWTLKRHLRALISPKPWTAQLLVLQPSYVLIWLRIVVLEYRAFETYTEISRTEKQSQIYSFYLGSFPLMAEPLNGS